MKLLQVEVYSAASNHAVIRLPERQFPGCVIQGDSLASLCADSKDLSERLQQLGISDEEALALAQSLQERLLDRLLHYQQVLSDHAVGLPYPAAVSESDLVTLVAE